MSPQADTLMVIDKSFQTDISDPSIPLLATVRIVGPGKILTLPSSRVSELPTCSAESSMSARPPEAAISFHSTHHDAKRIVLSNTDDS